MDVFQVLFSRRCKRGCWEFQEEYGIEIEITELLMVDDHILPDEGSTGFPQIQEPEKCTGIGWFRLDGLPFPLSVITANEVETYQRKTLKK